MADFIESMCDGLTGGTEGEAPAESADALADDVRAYDAYRSLRDEQLGVANTTPDRDDQDSTGGDSLEHSRHTMVALSTLQEERTKRQELETLNAARRQELVRLQALVAQAEQQYAATTRVNFDDDPRAYVEQREAQFGQQLQQQQMQLQQMQQQQLRGDIEQLSQHATRTEAEVVAEVGADAYNAAYNAFMRGADQRLAQQDPSATPEQRQQFLTMALARHVAVAQQRGQNPARHIYELAQREYGYRPQSNEQRALAAGDADFNAWFDSIRAASRIGPTA